ncbi:MAG: hypothetical protein MRY83_01500 [Flavobacteriales bacterium]|nr:hypothetical protein [Flavobacteriales bacterium]
MKISEEQIQNELSGKYKPLTVESGITTFPFSDLSDRDFELLSYLLVKEKIESNSFGNHSDIALMQGAAERGRDCVLYQNGEVSGLIQCKKYQARLTKPQFLKELIKFTLFAIRDPEILPNKENFEYCLFVSYDVTEPTLTLIKSFNSEIIKEILDDGISKYIDEVINEYESFKSFTANATTQAIYEILKKISVKYYNSTDLSRELNSNLKLAQSFFKIMSVVDLEGADNVIRKALDDYGLRMLTDIDLKSLQQRIGETEDKNRINLGFVDFFGYSTEFFKFIKGDELKKLMTSIADVSVLLNKQQLDFVNSQIHEYIQRKITHELLFFNRIHVFSVGIAAPYLFKRLSLKLVSRTMPQEMIHKIYPHLKLSKDELINKISEQLFESSNRVMKKDYSQLVGNPSVVQFKINLYNHIHQGLNNIDDAKEVFSKDIKIIKPVLDEIEEIIGKLIPDSRTVVIKDGSFFDNKDDILLLKKTIDKIEDE